MHKIIGTLVNVIESVSPMRADGWKIKFKCKSRIKLENQARRQKRKSDQRLDTSSCAAGMKALEDHTRELLWCVRQWLAVILWGQSGSKQMVL